MMYKWPFLESVLNVIIILEQKIYVLSQTIISLKWDDEAQK